MPDFSREQDIGRETPTESAATILSRMEAIIIVSLTELPEAASELLREIKLLRTINTLILGSDVED